MRFCFFLVVNLYVLVSLFAFEDKSNRVSVSGAYWGGYNLLTQNAYYRSQFDYAVNIDVNFQVNENVTGIAQLQTSPGNGSIGFLGPEAMLTDIFLYYEPTHNIGITFGSFDTPFGDEGDYLTNNADSFNQPFLLNNLLYSAFAGPTGTLNTLGLMVSHKTPLIQSTVALTNGTGETATNMSNTFEVVLREEVSISPSFLVGLSGMYSNDLSEANNTDTNSFGTTFSGYLGELKYDNHDILARASYGKLTYDDDDSETSDGVTVMSLQVGTTMDKLTVSTRYSAWLLSGANGTVSHQIRNIGLGVDHNDYTAGAASNLRRYQVGVTYVMQADTTLNTEWIWDDYENTEYEDVSGVLTYINIGFK